MGALIYIILATFIISLISFAGVLTLGLREAFLKRIIMLLVALSAGALIGGAFLHLIPESLEFFHGETLFIYVLAGFLLFYIIEHILKWRHCHDKECKIHSFAKMNLFGDTIHNFIDGVVIAASFIASIPLGISTTIAVAIHEIPQEFGDFGVLIHGGYKKGKALALNFLTAITAVLGGVLGYFFSSITQLSTNFLLPIAAGGFIYIAASDLIPEIRKEQNITKSTIYIFTFIIGIGIMFLLKLFSS